MDDTWLGKRNSPDTSENFEIKIDEIKRKNNYIKNAVHTNKPQKLIININNPSKFTQNKKKNNEKNGEDLSEVIETVGSINQVKVGISQSNNKDNMCYNNQYTPDKRIMINNTRKINIEDENNIEE
jgi:hypothetical protein